LQACGDVDAIAQHVLVLDHHIAQVDADPEADAAILRHIGLTSGQGDLDINGAPDGFDRAVELDEQAVAHGLDDPPAMPGDSWIDQGPSVGLQPRDRAFLVQPDQARVASHVGAHEGHQLALHRALLTDPTSHPSLLLRRR
jgi:hypothetical protein